MNELFGVALEALQRGDDPERSHLWHRGGHVPEGFGAHDERDLHPGA